MLPLDMFDGSETLVLNGKRYDFHNVVDTSTLLTYPFNRMAGICSVIGSFGSTDLVLVETARGEMFVCPLTVDGEIDLDTSSWGVITTAPTADNTKTPVVIARVSVSDLHQAEPKIAQVVTDTTDKALFYNLYCNANSPKINKLDEMWGVVDKIIVLDINNARERAELTTVVIFTEDNIRLVQKHEHGVSATLVLSDGRSLETEYDDESWASEMMMLNEDRVVAVYRSHKSIRDALKNVLVQPAVIITPVPEKLCQAVSTVKWVPSQGQLVRVRGEGPLLTIVDVDVYQREFIVQRADAIQVNPNQFHRVSTININERFSVPFTEVTPMVLTY